MTLTSTLQQHLRVDKPNFELLQQVSRFSKDLYNSALYIQRQHFFANKKILSLGELFKQVKIRKEYLQLPSDLAQQVLIILQRNFSSFFSLLKLKNAGNYSNKLHLPYYLDKDDYNHLIFIDRLFSQNNNQLKLSLGNRGRQSTGHSGIFLDPPPLGLTPKQIRIIPRYKARYFEIEYIYELDPIPRFKPVIPDSYLAIDLGLKNFASCVTTTGTAFIVEGSGIKSFNRWWNKRYANYQSKINQQGITGVTKKGARMQRYRKYVIDNYLNHVVRYIIDYCLDKQLETIIVGDWQDMKRSLSMRKATGQLFQQLPYMKFKKKLAYKAELHDIKIQFQEESYTSQDCFNCGLRRKANRRYRGLYSCIKCGMQLNADINGALNIMRKVVPKQSILNYMNSLQWNSGEITSPSRIQLVDFV